MNVWSVPITAVGSRAKGTDKTAAEQKAETKGDQADDSPVVTEQEEVVFVVQADGTVKKVVVQTGVQDINYIEVKSGISEPLDVVTSPYTAVSKSLKDGSKVKVVKKEELFEK